MAKLSVNQVLLKAKSHAKKGEIEEAQKLYKDVLQAFPKNKRAQQGLAALNRPESPNATQGPPQETINQIINLYNQGQLGAVVEQAKALTLQYPGSFMVWNLLGAANKGLGQVQAAAEAFSKETELNPTYADGFSNLGVTLKEQGRLDEAIASYKKALSLKPNYAEACNNLGVAVYEQGKLEEGIGFYKKALSLKPDYEEPYYNTGNALQKQGRADEAIASYGKALSIRPNYAEAYNNMGTALDDLGKPEEAIAAYEKALALKPYYAEVHRNLSSLIKYKPEDTQVALVSEMIHRLDLTDDDRCQLLYTYAKMNEDLGDLEEAYKNYVAGGKLRQSLLHYDFSQDELIFDQIKNAAPNLKDFSFNKPLKAAKNTPIFILGMLRSGTSLVEQIISSHSKIHGAGELPFLSKYSSAMSKGNQIVNSENIFRIREAYLDELEQVSDGFPFVTDKMPQNFLHIGLLLKALPEAKVIHVKRDPAATCWSNFKHYFAERGLGYSYDLTDTVKYFRLYQDLMEFWDQHYGEHIYHLDYEKLTLEQEIETRKLIEHLELDWEDNCLSPQENKRSVRTASQQQVRQKVYTGSSQAWRKFEPFFHGAFDSITP